MAGFSCALRLVRAGGAGIVLLVAALCLSSENTSRADGDVPPAAGKEAALYQQSLVVTVAKPAEGQKLEDFCSDKEGRILALIGQVGNEPQGLSFGPFSSSANTKKPPKFEPSVHIFDATGKLVAQWKVGFAGQAINTAPDGTVLVGGDGRVARFDLTGKKLHESQAPQMIYIKEHPDEMRERAKEQLESDKEMYAGYIEEYEEQLKILQDSKKKEADDTKTSKPVVDVQERQLKQIINSYRVQLKGMEKRTVEDTLKTVVGRASRVHAISASADNVFVTCPAMAGYGYGVWRTDNEFDHAKEIVKSLSGCCGQMDVQCKNGELYVCENSRHRVIRFDIDGKELGQFGKRDRAGEGENFGGCCNPMNLCFSKNGNLFVSESNGVVKHFTTAGKYLGIVGIAKVDAGCKNSCVAVNTDESRLYYIDIDKSKIIVLNRNEEQARK